MSDQPNAGNCTCTTYITHKRQTSMPPAGFKLAIPTWDRSQIHALDRAVTGITTYER